jgi:serine/threonine-protein kinase HSL1 (negative regulator of Swe1 kinase)
VLFAKASHRLTLLKFYFQGRVRIARNVKTSQLAAVKIVNKIDLLKSRVSLKNIPAHSEQVLLSIEREIVVMKLIEHPNIIQLYDVWETSTELYLILEYVEGGELFEYLCEKGRLSTNEALGYFQQIITAMDYCHRFNIAHRDLKPENLLLDENMNIKVADFGMAAWQQTDSLLETACGSPHYAAPELIRGEAYKGSAADIWSCGVILYALLAGRLPFDDEDLVTLLNKVKLGNFEIPDAIDPLAKDLIRKMLEKDASKRITIPQIQAHPFYTSQEPKLVDHKMPNLDETARPILKDSDIDMDILKNLGTLWHGMPEKDIIERLKVIEPNWYKAVYHLLIRYREKHLEEYDEEEEARHRQRRMKHGPALKPPTLPSGMRRTSSRVTDLGQPSPRTSSRTDSFSPSDNNLRLDVPQITLRSPTASPAESPLIRSPPSLERFVAPTSPISQMLEALGTPPLNVPDASMKEYINELGVRLSQLQAAYANGASVGASSNVMEFDTRNSSRLKITNNTKPLSIGRTSETDKENWDTQGRTKGITHKSSLRTSDGDGMKRPSLRVHIVEPSKVERFSMRRKPKDFNPASPAFSDSSFTLPSTPRRSWFGNVFKFKPTSFVLLSVHDAYTSREECRRMLVGLGIRVSLSHSEGLGILKCKLDEVKDPARVITSVKAVRFRVEVHRPSTSQTDAGFEVALHLLQEKGASSSFQAVYARLRKNWDLDAPKTPLPFSPALTEGGYSTATV